MHDDVNTKAALLRLLKFCLLPRRKMICWVVLLVAVFNLTELMLPKLIELYILSVNGEAKTLLGFDVSFLNDDLGKMLYLPLALLFMAVMKWILSFARIYYQGVLGQDVLKDVRQRIYDRVQRFPFDYHDEKHSGTLISNLVEDVRHATMFFQNSIFMIMEGAVFSVIALTFLFTHDIYAGFASLGILIIGWILSLLVYRHAFPIFGRTKRLFASMVGEFTENMEGQLVVRAYGQKDKQGVHYRDTVDELHKSNFSEIQWSIFAAQMVHWAALIGIPVVLFCHIYFNRQAGIPVEGATIFLIFTTQIMLVAKSRQLVYNFEQLVRFAVTARRLNDFFDPAKNNGMGQGRLELDPKFQMIEFAGVSFAYGDREQVIKNVSFKFDQGGILGIAGSTGAGKTTLVNLMAGFYQPNSGKILIDDHLSEDFECRKLRRSIAVVFQETFLFAGSVSDNISFGSPLSEAEDVKWAAEVAQATEFINELPDGFETEVGEKGISLSGGQRQRIGIARALMHKPSLLILDSCTSALDTKTEKNILAELRKLKGMTTVIISHRRSALELSDYLLVMEEGDLKEKGKPAELVKPGSLYMQIMESTSD